MHEDDDPDFLAGVQVGDLVHEKYLVESNLGAGGMGFVVGARDQLLQRRVAIKFLQPSLTNAPQAVQRFMREARIASSITSEHAVKILEVDKLTSGAPFLAMEYLEGRDLQKLLDQDGPLRLNVAVDYLMQAMEAIAEGHARGIVHRDIKPSNLFLSRRADGTPLVKVLDFGIAKTVERDGAYDTTLTGPQDTRFGSPAYMSPEQLQQPEAVDFRSDIWSLGATLYALVCGSQLFRAATYPELVLAVTQAPIQRPRQRRPNLECSRAFEQALLRCLERDPARRYATVAEFANTLAGHGGDDARAALRRIRGVEAAFPRVSAHPGGTDATDTLRSPATRVRATFQPVESASLARAAPHPRATLLLLAGVGALGGVLALRQGSCGQQVPARPSAQPVSTGALRVTSPPLQQSTPPAPAPVPGEAQAVAAIDPPARPDAVAAIDPPARPDALAARSDAAATPRAQPRPPAARAERRAAMPAASTPPATLPAAAFSVESPVNASTSTSASPTAHSSPPPSSDGTGDGRLPEIEQLIERRR